MGHYSVINFYDNAVFSKEKVMINKMLETENSKEIRICLSKDQLMKEHTAPAPIIVMVLDGVIKFSINSSEYLLNKGDIINLAAKVSHSLLALEDSIVRLSLAKAVS
jgi:quercetin dioxygenase-like cupin family protein